MTFFAPRWALTAQALDSATDPRLATGIHIHLMPSAMLGLPAVPFLVYRLNLGAGATLAQPRTDVRWVDSHGVALTPPFTVTPDNPVTGWLPPAISGAVCCWFELDANPVSFGPVGTRLGSLAPSVINRIATVELDALIATPRGPAPVASRSTAPYQVAASRIEMVLVHGSGTVTGARWIDASSLQPGQLWRRWSLPVPDGFLYAGLSTAYSDVKARIRAGAPLLQSLYQAPASTSAATAPPATVDDEFARIDPFMPPLGNFLDQLINDTLMHPWLLTEPFRFGTTQGQVPLLTTLLHASLDPGIARWLGFSDLDAAPPAPGEVVVYLIRGAWLSLGHGQIDPQLFAQIPKDAQLSDEAVASAFGVGPVRAGTYLDLWAAAAATAGTPPDRPLPPQFDVPEPGPWLPRTPPDRARVIGLPVHGAQPGGAVALARQDSRGLVGLNPKSSSGAVLALVAGKRDIGRLPGQARFEDREALEEATQYRIAQADWFGRWSDWATVTAAAQARTPPPVPMLELSYDAPVALFATPPYAVPPTPPSYGAPPPPPPTDARHGQLGLQVPLPAPGELPPGAYPLAALKINAVGGPWSFNATLPIPAAAGTVGALTLVAAVPGTATTPPVPARLLVAVQGPDLLPAASQDVTVRVAWVDAAPSPVTSDWSIPITRRLHDPRPPAAPPTDSTLTYSARPDATGRARVELTWSVTPGSTYRVFYADEGQLLKGLRHVANDGIIGGVHVDATTRTSAATALADLTAAATLGAADRAARFVTHAALFGWPMFQNLTPRPLGDGKFDHDLSGSLRTLSFYRVIATSAANVSSPFQSAPLRPVAIPNDGPPARPDVTVTARPGAPLGTAQLTIRVPHSAVAPVRYRVRRSIAGDEDPRRLLITTPERDLPGDARDDGHATIFVHDDGVVLRPWQRTSWAVEVRGGPPAGSPPGTSIAGEWSPPSPMVSTLMVPTTPPDPVQIVAATRDSASQVTLHWTHGNPSLFIATSAGPHRVAAYRLAAGQRAVPVAFRETPFPDATGAFSAAIDAPATPASYVLVVVDPLGRTSGPSNSITVSSS